MGFLEKQGPVEVEDTVPASTSKDVDEVEQ